MCVRLTLPWPVRPSACAAASLTSGLQSSHVSTTSLEHRSWERGGGVCVGGGGEEGRVCGGRGVCVWGGGGIISGDQCYFSMASHKYSVIKY